MALGINMLDKYALANILSYVRGLNQIAAAGVSKLWRAIMLERAAALKDQGRGKLGRAGEFFVLIANAHICARNDIAIAAARLGDTNTLKIMGKMDLYAVYNLCPKDKTVRGSYNLGRYGCEADICEFIRNNVYTVHASECKRGLVRAKRYEIIKRNYDTWNLSSTGFILKFAIEHNDRELVKWCNERSKNTPANVCRCCPAMYAYARGKLGINIGLLRITPKINSSPKKMSEMHFIMHTINPHACLICKHIIAGKNMPMHEVWYMMNPGVYTSGARLHISAFTHIPASVSNIARAAFDTLINPDLFDPIYARDRIAVLLKFKLTIQPISLARLVVSHRRRTRETINMLDKAAICSRDKILKTIKRYLISPVPADIVAVLSS